MAKGTLMMSFKVKHAWLIMLINYPLVKFGFDVYIPKFCIEYGKPYFAENE